MKDIFGTEIKLGDKLVCFGVKYGGRILLRCGNVIAFTKQRARLDNGRQATVGHCFITNDDRFTPNGSFNASYDESWESNS